MRPGDLVIIDDLILAIIIDHPQKMPFVGYVIPVLRPDGIVDMAYPETLRIVCKGPSWSVQKEST